MVTRHPGLALTPLGTGSTVGPRKACWESTDTLSLYSHVQSSFIVSFIPLQFPKPYTHSRLSHLAPLQPGSHSQWPVTWWQLALWTQSQLCSQPSPKNPLEQASDETHKRASSAYNIRVWGQNVFKTFPFSNAYLFKANCTNCFDTG